MIFIKKSLSPIPLAWTVDGLVVNGWIECQDSTPASIMSQHRGSSSLPNTKRSGLLLACFSAENKPQPMLSIEFPQDYFSAFIERCQSDVLLSTMVHSSVHTRFYLYRVHSRTFHRVCNPECIFLSAESSSAVSSDCFRSSVCIERGDS